jgi:hypothetical protein
MYVINIRYICIFVTLYRLIVYTYISGDEQSGQQDPRCQHLSPKTSSNQEIPQSEGACYISDMHSSEVTGCCVTLNMAVDHEKLAQHILT